MAIRPPTPWCWIKKCGDFRVVRTQTQRGSDVKPDVGAAITLDQRDAERVAGRLTANDDMALNFDLPITDQVLEPAGTPLPADGGEPGKVLLSHVAAIHSGDIDELMALSPPDKAEAMRESVAAGETEELLKMARFFTPTNIVVTGGRHAGDKAWVDFPGQAPGGAVAGLGMLVRVDGQWGVSKINTRRAGE